MPKKPERPSARFPIPGFKLLFAFKLHRVYADASDTLCIHWSKNPSYADFKKIYGGVLRSMRKNIMVNLLVSGYAVEAFEKKVTWYLTRWYLKAVPKGLRYLAYVAKDETSLRKLRLPLQLLPARVKLFPDLKNAYAWVKTTS